MKGLLLRLSALDADAENAVRVIGFFDKLVSGRVTLRTLVRETARLAECSAGVTDAELGVCLRADHTGRILADVQDPADALVRDLSPTSRVWLERTGTPLALDDIVLERFSIAAALLLEHTRGPLPELGDAALVELALSASAGEVERARAVRLMRFEPATELHVMAVAAEPAAVKGFLAALGESSPGVRAASLGRVHAVLTRSLPPNLADLPAKGMRVGVSDPLPVIDAPEAWQQARTALRFATLDALFPAVVRAGELGAFAAIAARLRAQDIAQVADVAALDSLADEQHGADTLAVLTAYCATGSARKAAAEVYRHHSTVMARLAHAETRLGFSFGAPSGRLRLELAILLRQLRDTAE
ncbi:MULTISPECIES: helix-turn-helix domain-containing protein [unclassified Streptomyces]|uniref:PucR family transcriptional regulator n=1 Tax=unclassified Streptomyces TaxID=2593676 RepID=UPI0033AD85BD